MTIEIVMQFERETKAFYLYESEDEEAGADDEGEADHG